MARQISDANKYIWIYKVQGVNYLDLVAEILTDVKGVYVYRDKDNNALIWRFDRAEWSEETARIYAYSTVLTKNEAMKSFNSINEYDGITYMSSGERNMIYKNLKRFGVDQKLNNMEEYKNAKEINDKMKLLAQSSNSQMIDFINSSLQSRLDVTKSDNKPDFDFKVFGNIEYKSVNNDGTDEARLVTTFTSNTADLENDIVSKSALEKAIKSLNERVIPIRFEHGKEDFGVWDKFDLVEDGDKVVAKAEGLLDLSLNRSKDLWKEITEYGKQFASSYGAYFKSIHKEKINDQYVTVVDDIDFFEISLTTRPANPDTVVNSIKKGFRNFIKNIELKNMEETNINTAPVAEATQEVVHANPEVIAEAVTETPVVEEKKDEVVTDATIEATTEETKSVEDKQIDMPTDNPNANGETTAWDMIVAISTRLDEVYSKLSDIYDMLNAQKSEVDTKVEDTQAKVDSLQNELKSIKGSMPARKSIVATQSSVVPTQDDSIDNKELEEIKKNYPMQYSMIVKNLNK